MYFAYRYPAASTYRVGIGVLAACAVVPAGIAVAAFTSGRGGAMLVVGIMFAAVAATCWLVCLHWWRAMSRRDGGGYGITVVGDRVRSVDWDVVRDRVTELALADLVQAEPQLYRGRSMIEVTTGAGHRHWLPASQLDADSRARLLAVLPPPQPSARQLEVVAALRGALREVLAVEVGERGSPVATDVAGGVSWSFRFGTEPAIELEPGRGGSAGYAAATLSLDVYRVRGAVDRGRAIDLEFAAEDDALAGDVSRWSSATLPDEVLAQLDRATRARRTP